VRLDERGGAASGSVSPTLMLRAQPAVVETPMPMSPGPADEDVDATPIGSGAHEPGSIPSIQRVPPTPELEQGFPRAYGDDDDEEEVECSSSEEELVTTAGRVWRGLRRTADVFFPTLLAAPAVLLLTLTLPVVVTPHGAPGAPEKSPGGPIASLSVPAPPLVDGHLVDWEEEGVERALVAEEEVQEEMHDHLRFSKWLMVAQCVLGPLFVAAVLFGASPCFLSNECGSC
jgi:sodium/potassium/calcium exchanger 6